MPLDHIPLVCHTCGRTYLVHPCRRDVSRFCSKRCTGKSPKARYYPPLEERFWAKVQKTESCWLWTGSLGTKGHGLFRIGKRITGAYRYSWELHRGPIPDGSCVLHNCPGGDNPACVNPDHLWLGSIADNNTDRDQKGRSVVLVGEAHYRAALTDEQVIEIRRRYAAGGITHQELADLYGSSKRAVGAAVRRQTWKHL